MFAVDIALGLFGRARIIFTLAGISLNGKGPGTSHHYINI
jgi:hypothetical protein